VGVIALFYATVQTVATNVARQGVQTGFGFLGREAGFAINQSLIPYSHESTYAAAIFVAFLNTLLLAGLTIMLCTVFGLFLAFARMSSNWLLSKLAQLYVEMFRNVPLRASANRSISLVSLSSTSRVCSSRCRCSMKAARLSCGWPSLPSRRRRPFAFGRAGDKT